MAASQEDVLICLRASLAAPSPQVEEHLRALSCLPGYGVTLCQLALSQGSDAAGEPGVVQLAAILLKKYVKEHWVEDSRGFVPPIAGDTDKAAIRHMLPAGLAHPSSKVRTAIGMAIAAIASWDWPQDWPGLMESLVGAIKARNNEHLVRGSLSCLSLMSTDIDERLMPQIAQVLLPELHAIVASGQFPELQRQAISILHGMVATLGMMGGKEQRQLRDLMTPYVLPWISSLAEILGSPISLQEPVGWGIKTEALKVLVQLVSYFSKQLAPHAPLLLAKSWQLFARGLEVYQEALVENQTEVSTVEVDTDGNPLDLEMLLAQMFELLLAFVSSSRFQPQLKAATSDLVKLTIGYMQMTHNQVETWSMNPNQFVADGEEETFTSRVSGELLLDEINQSFGRECALMTLQGIELKLAEAAQQLLKGKPSWWQLREAALLALGTCSDHLMRATKSKGGSGQDGGEAVVQRLRALIDDMMTRDLQGGQGHMLLASRALWVASRYSNMMTAQQIEQYVHAATMGVQSSQPAQVRIGSCWVLARLAPKAGRATLKPLLPQLYEALVGLLLDSSEETLHLVLETLTVVLKADGEVVQQFLPQISRPVLQLWSLNMNDPLISQDALEVLEALARNPACLEPFTTQVLPTLAQTLHNPDAHPSYVLEGSLDLLCTVVKQPNINVARGVYESVGTPLHHLMMTSDDPGTLQSGMAVLSKLVRTGGREMLIWGPTVGDTSSVLSALLEVLKRLLDIHTSESQSCFVGDLLLEMLKQLPHVVLAPLLAQLLDGVVLKLLHSNMMPLISGLLLVIAKMITLAGPAQILDALASRTVSLPGGPVNSLEAVMPILLERSCDVHGAAKLSLMATALGSLVESKHPALMQLMVKGKRLDMAGGVKTRTQATKSGGEQWSQIPAATRILAVLAEMLADVQDEPRKGLVSDCEEDDLDDDLDDDDFDEDEEDCEEDEDEGGGLEVAGAGFSAEQQRVLDSELNGNTSPLPRASTDTGGAPGGCSAHGGSKEGGGEALNVGSYLQELLIRIGSNDRALVETAWQHAMSERQIKAVSELFKAK